MFFNKLIEPLKSSITLVRQCSTSSNLVISEVRNKIMYIGINRPNMRNCVNRATAQQLLSSFKEFDERDDVSSGVLYGVGGNFCAGYDLEELSGMQNIENAEQLISPAPMGPSHYMTKKPLVASIDGYAVAGGLELALLCDLRVVEEDAVLGVFCRRFGVPLIDGGTVRLPAIIGLGRALDLILTGRAIKGPEALSMGLATQCVDVGTAFGRASQLAESLIKFPQLCLQKDRESAYHSVFSSNNLKEALDFEYRNGKEVIIKEAIRGAKLFSQSKLGRHGKFNLNAWPELMSKGEPKESKLFPNDPVS